MPVLEDGLSDSECLSDDEQSSPVKSKSNGRHQSTQSDFLFDSNHSPLITSSHKQQFAKSAATTTTTNGPESQSKSFYIRPPPPSSFVRPVTTNRSTPTEPNWNPQKTPSDESTTLPAGKKKTFFCSVLIRSKAKQNLDEGNIIPKPLRKKGL
jgi:hypothetical protein